MPGLLADVNVQGHLGYLQRLIESLEVYELILEAGLEFATFRGLGLDRRLDDRALWNYCQLHHWVLLTENRNHEDRDSLHATLADSWCEGHLPVLTLANKGRFENSEAYARRVAEDVAWQLVAVFIDRIRIQPRIFVPL